MRAHAQPRPPCAPRPPIHHPPSHRASPAGTTPTIANSTFAPDVIVLHHADGPNVPLHATEAVTTAVRGALMKHADDPPPPLITGHAPNGHPLQSDHLAIVPLPATTTICAPAPLHGIALVLPSSADLHERLRLLDVLTRWERAHDPGGPQSPGSILTLGRLGRLVLRHDPSPFPIHDSSRHWTATGRQWTSITPILLDRHPGSFHRGKPSARRRAARRADETITSACRRTGLPAPERIELSPTPFVAGSTHARRFDRHRHNRRDPRPMMHARLTFPTPVRGPVLLGAGRYRGLGLLVPVG